MQPKPFDAGQFTATEWDGAEQKAKFANHFARFVESDFNANLFHDWFYKRLSNCFFAHRAHFNRRGFYETWFADLPRRRDFLINALRHPCYGDPKFTYSDVERVLKAWIAESGLIEKYVAAITAATELRERADLARLKAKYEEPEAAR